MARKVTVKQPDPPKEAISVTVLAEAIVAISDAVTQMRKGPLNDKALLLLIQHAMPIKARVGVREISEVLDALQYLKDAYLKQHQS